MKYTYKGHKIEIQEQTHITEAGEERDAGWIVKVSGPAYSLYHHTYTQSRLTFMIERAIDDKLAAQGVQRA